MKKASIILVILIVLVGAFAIIKHNDKKTSTTTKSNTSKVISTQPIATNKVTISNRAFSPIYITVKKGATVTWTNKDSVAHTVTEIDGQAGPKSQDLNQGQTYSYTFSTAGTFKYECTIHLGMTGTVVVTE